MRLDQVPSGQSVEIVSLTHEGARLRRLLEMGLFEGTHITVVRRAPLGDPLQVSMGDFHISLRVADAALIEVKE